MYVIYPLVFLCFFPNVSVFCNITVFFYWYEDTIIPMSLTSALCPQFWIGLLLLTLTRTQTQEEEFMIFYHLSNYVCLNPIYVALTRNHCSHHCLSLHVPEAVQPLSAVQLAELLIPAPFCAGPAGKGFHPNRPLPGKTNLCVSPPRGQVGWSLEGTLKLCTKRRNVTKSVFRSVLLPKFRLAIIGFQVGTMG